MLKIIKKHFATKTVFSHYEGSAKVYYVYDWKYTVFKYAIIALALYVVFVFNYQLAN